MIHKKAKNLTLENFKKYGTFSALIDPDTVLIGEKPVEFFRDIIQDDNQGTASFSVCRVEKRDFVVDCAEYHNFANESILPIDGDIYIHVAPASGDDVASDKFEIFFVPKGTMVVIRRGVWHHAPFTANKKAVNALIILPERTYWNDCIIADIESDKRVKFEGI